MVYLKKSAPKRCDWRQKLSEICRIHYNYDRIEYSKNKPHEAKENEIVFLDLDALPQYSADEKETKTFNHKSTHKSIRCHPCCNKSTSIDVRLQLFAVDWTAECKTTSKIKNIDALTPSIELGYSTIVRYFYFYSLLCRLRGWQNHATININGCGMKKALIASNADEQEMLKNLDSLN